MIFVLIVLLRFFFRNGYRISLLPQSKLLHWQELSPGHAYVHMYSGCTDYMRKRYGNPAAHAYSFGVHGFPKPITYYDPVLSLEPVWWSTHLPFLSTENRKPAGICGSACDCCDQNCKEGLTFVTEHCTEVYLHYFCINAAVVRGLPRRLSVRIVLTQRVTVFLWCKY